MSGGPKVISLTSTLSVISSTYTLIKGEPLTAVPLSLLLYFVLELLYWFSFLHSVLLHSVSQLTQLALDPGFNLPMWFVSGDKFPQSYSSAWQYTEHWTWFFLQRQWPVHTALQLQDTVTRLLVDYATAAAWSVICQHKYLVELLTDLIWKASVNLGGIWNARCKHWGASGSQGSHYCRRGNFWWS